MDCPSESARWVVFFISTALFQRCSGGLQVLAGELCIRQTEAVFPCRWNHRPGLFPEQVQGFSNSSWCVLEGGQSFAGRPWPRARAGAGWTSAALVQGGRSCETALPTLAAVCGRTQGPGAKGRASPEPCPGFTSSPGSLLRAGRAAGAGVCELSVLGDILGWASLSCTALPSPGGSFPLQFHSTVWVPAGLISIFTCFPVGFITDPPGTASFCSFGRFWSWLRVFEGQRKAQQL